MFILEKNFTYLEMHLHSNENNIPAELNVKILTPVAIVR